jgi:hypothetical protein
VSNVEKLIMDLKESLERELAALRQTMQQGFSRINDRFDSQAEHLDRLADSIERAVVKLGRESA